MVMSPRLMKLVGESGPPPEPWAPDDLAMLYQWLQNPSDLMEYEATLVEGRYVLKDHARTGTLRRPGQGRRLDFDGNNDNCLAATRASTGAPTALSGGALVKITAGHSKMHCINAEWGAAAARMWKFEVDQTTLAIRLTLSSDGTNSITFTTTETLAAATLTHIWFSYDGGAGTVSIFIDGVAATVTPSGAVPSALIDAAVVYSAGSDAAGNSDMLGSIADLRIYQAAKTLAQVQAIRDQANTPTTYDTTGLRAWHPIVEECCSVLHDCSGNGIHLIILNGSTLPTGNFFAADSTIPFNFANEFGCSFGRTILRVANGTWNGAWRSENVLSGDGYITWTVDALNANTVFGASTDESFTPTNNQNNIDFGVAWETSTTILLYTNGGITASHTHTLAIGDRVSIVRTGGSNLKVQVNGVDVPGATFAATSSADLYAWCAINLSTITPDCISINGAEPRTGRTQAVQVYKHVMPRSLATPAEDCYGNPIHYTGQCRHVATTESACVAGNAASTNDASAVHLNANQALLPPSANFTLRFAAKLSTVAGCVFGQYTTLGGVGRMRLQQEGTGSVSLTIGATTVISFSGVISVPAGTWQWIELERVGNDWTLTIEVPSLGMKAIGTGSNSNAIQNVNTCLLCAWDTYDTSRTLTGNGTIAYLSVETGGVTKIWPLQEGAGDAGTNRTYYGRASDDSAVTAFTAVNGTPATINGGVCTLAPDDIVRNGGRIVDAISICKNGSVAGDGNALTHDAGEWVGGNVTRVHRINHNPFSAALLNGCGVETAYAAGTARESVAPNSTKFRRTNSTDDIDDRFFIAVASRAGVAAPTGLSGADLTNAQAYVS
jgi:hypothetical protein